MYTRYSQNQNSPIFIMNDKVDQNLFIINSYEIEGGLEVYFKKNSSG